MAPVTPWRPTLPQRSLERLVESLGEQGLDRQRLRAAAGLDATSATPEARAPMAGLVALWEAALALSEDPLVTLAVGRDCPLGRWGVIEHLAMASSNLTRLLEDAQAYWALVTDDRKEITIFEEPGVVGIAYGSPHCDVPAAYEMDMAYLVRWLRERLGRGVDVREVRFRHAPRADRSRYVTHFGAGVRFESEHDAVLIGAEVLALPFRSADPGLHQTLREQAGRRLEALEDEGAAARAVSRALAGDLVRANLNSVAAALSVAPRTLQRRLRAEGASFQGLLDEARKSRALSLLKQGELSQSEIAFVLGFSQPSALHHAVKRWFDATPGALRGPAARG